MGNKHSPSALTQLFDQISTRAESSIQALIDQRKQLIELRASKAQLVQQYESALQAFSKLESQKAALEADYQQKLEQNSLLEVQNKQLADENRILNTHLEALAEKLNAFADTPVVTTSDQSMPTAVELGDQPELGVEVVDKFSAKEILVQWSERYPNAFSKMAVQPLKIGIHEDLSEKEILPDHWIRRALASYVRQPRYLRTIKSGAVRLDLTGSNAGFVTAEEAQHAKAQLDEIRKQRQQKEQQLKEKQEAKRLQSKLAQLIGKH